MNLIVILSILLFILPKPTSLCARQYENTADFLRCLENSQTHAIAHDRSMQRLLDTISEGARVGIGDIEGQTDSNESCHDLFYSQMVSLLVSAGNSKNISMLERANLSPLYNEKKLAMAGFVDGKGSISLLGATHVLQGFYRPDPISGPYSLKIIEAESGRVLTSVSGTFICKQKNENFDRLNQVQVINFTESYVDVQVQLQGNTGAADNNAALYNKATLLKTSQKVFLKQLQKCGIDSEMAMAHSETSEVSFDTDQGVVVVYRYFFN